MACNGGFLDHPLVQLRLCARNWRNGINITVYIRHQEPSVINEIIRIRCVQQRENIHWMLMRNVLPGQLRLECSAKLVNINLGNPLGCCFQQVLCHEQKDENGHKDMHSNHSLSINSGISITDQQHTSRVRLHRLLFRLPKCFRHDHLSSAWLRRNLDFELYLVLYY